MKGIFIMEKINKPDALPKNLTLATTLIKRGSTKQL